MGQNLAPFEKLVNMVLFLQHHGNQGSLGKVVLVFQNQEALKEKSILLFNFVDVNLIARLN